MKNRLLILTVLLLLATPIVLAAGKVSGTMAKAKTKKFTLVIDPGHGGHDAGAIGRLTKEKTINLNVALGFGRLVERNCPDVKVIYTRKTDVFIPLHTRADIANRNKADLFISVHTNALPRGHISRGMETYTLGMHRAADNLAVAKRENEVILYEQDYKQRYQGFDPKSSESYIMFEFMQDRNMAQSVELAKCVQRRTTNIARRQDKGVKQAGFLVLRETSMPSCLIELGFISTPDEERFLHSSDGVSLLAEGIYMAFLDYKRKYDGNIVVPLKAETKQEVTIPSVVPDDEKPVAKKEKKRKKSKMAQDLEDAREGRSVPVVTAEADKGPSIDSIVAATPQAPSGAAQSGVAVAPQQSAAAVPQPSAAVASQPGVAATSQQPVAESPQKTVATPVVKTQPEPSVKQVPQATALMTPVAPAAPESATADSAPVFKVQVLASGVKLKTGDRQLKGQKQAEYYQEGGLYKYTVGASSNYNEIYQLRKSLATSFPQAFIIAFKDGKKVNVQEAIREWRSKKGR